LCSLGGDCLDEHTAARRRCCEPNFTGCLTWRLPQRPEGRRRLSITYSLPNGVSFSGTFAGEDPSNSFLSGTTILSELLFSN
jgi:hypothetical protein